MGKPSGPRLLNEDAGWRRCPFGARRGLLANLLDQALQSLKVALGDSVERVERQCDLVLLLGAGKVAQLPEALRQTILRLNALLHLDLCGEGEHGAICVGGLLPTPFGGSLQRYVGMVARCAPWLLGGALVGEGHVLLLH